ncbi:MAG: MFS transporter [Chlamydiales bacterium]
MISLLKKKGSRFHSIYFLNITQFLGALNDNIVKYLIVFFLIQVQGISNTNTILLWVGVIYVTPFLIFSPLAGLLADLFSKQRLIVLLKMSEIFITLFGFFTFLWSNTIACYTFLFLLSIHSSIFSPAKYSIIPELVSKSSIPKANGIISAFTYLAIILGGLFASFITQVTRYNFTLCALIPLTIAVLGFIASLKISPTHSSNSSDKNIFRSIVFSEIFKTLQMCRKKEHLILVMLSNAFFLFLGAFFQLNIILFSIQSLHLSSIGGGYLFPVTALGIMLGAFIAGKFLQNQIEIGLSYLALFALSIFCILLPLAIFSYIFVIVLLFLIGFAGGLFVVPLDSFIQTNSPEGHLGKVAASLNFLSFFGVFIAPILLYFFNNSLGFTAASSFLIIGVITAIIAITMILQSLREVLRFIGKFFFSKYANFPSIPANIPACYIVYPLSWKSVLFLLSKIPDVQLYLVGQRFSLFHLIIPKNHILEWKDTSSMPSGDLYNKVKHKTGKHQCLLISKTKPLIIQTQYTSKIEHALFHIHQSTISLLFLPHPSDRNPQ